MLHVVIQGLSKPEETQQIINCGQLLILQFWALLHSAAHSTGNESYWTVPVGKYQMRNIWCDQVPHLTEKLSWLKQLIMWKICTKAKKKENPSCSTMQIYLVANKHSCQGKMCLYLEPLASNLSTADVVYRVSTPIQELCGGLLFILSHQWWSLCTSVWLCFNTELLSN